MKYFALFLLIIIVFSSCSGILDSLEQKNFTIKNESGFRSVKFNIDGDLEATLDNGKSKEISLLTGAYANYTLEAKSNSGEPLADKKFKFISGSLTVTLKRECWEGFEGCFCYFD